ncbi:MAG: hypothetical protein JRH20_21740 [Deltaproteobacteria bacterium]|nr:hypothetical protein [Deltaproteobacteria bacterium]
MRYKIPAAGQLVATNKTTVLLRRPGGLDAYSPEDGHSLWSTPIAGLRKNERTIALCGKRIYALTATGLVIVDSQSGKVQHTQAFREPSAVHCTSRSISISHAKGVTQFDASGLKILASSTTRGTLLAVEGEHAILFRQLEKSVATSPQRLTVIDLAKKKTAYEFRLLRGGAHQFMHAAGGTLALLDYSLPGPGGEGKRKLYFTRADYRAGKKLSDVSLAHHYPKGDIQGFKGVHLADGRLFVVSQGKGGDHIALLYQRVGNKIAWKRTLPAGALALRRVGKVLWVMLASTGGELLALDLDDGHTRQRVSLDGSPRGELLNHDQSIYLKTDKSFWRLSPVAKQSQPDKRKKWRTYRDTLAGYMFALPQSWRLVAKRIQHYGKGRFSVPFVRYRQEDKRWIFLASVHVLVRPVANQTVDALANSVLEQWKRRMGKANLARTRRWKRGAKTFLLSSYRFQNRYRRQETSHSLCVISHGFAFELRARTSAEGEKLWPEIIEALEGFQPRPELVGTKDKAGGAKSNPLRRP